MTHPISLVVTDDLKRSRLTVFFRLLLVIPHFIWLWLWSILATLVLLVAWFAALFTKRVPQGIHDFLASFLRYQVHVYSYMSLVADPYPSFSGIADYPVTASIAPPAEQGRLGVFFRFFLALPAALFSGVLNYFTEVLALFAWFVCLALGRIPEGMRNLLAFSVRFHAQTQGYLYLLTGRYPSFDMS
ncbi:MAG TPA: DUF4389 domain-containing protein [Gaiellaceae bacterium]|jgi:hypothetical protein|nr:DUF4389 domain-containing protein [Gaiellaceae bacterium]